MSHINVIGMIGVLYQVGLGYVKFVKNLYNIMQLGYIIKLLGQAP